MRRQHLTSTQFAGKAEEDGDLEFSHSQEYNLQINKSRGEEEASQKNKVHKKENKHEAVAA